MPIHNDNTKKMRKVLPAGPLIYGAMDGNVSLFSAMSNQPTVNVQGTTGGVSTSFLTVRLTDGTSFYTASGGGGGAADGSAFTAGTTTFSGDGGVFNDGLAVLSSGVQGTTRITSYRALHTNLRNNSGVEIGIIASPIYARITDGTNTMPTMDAIARKGFHAITDGTNTAAVLNAAPGSDTGQSALAVRVISQLGAGSGGGGVATDNTTFTAGTTTFSADGGVFNDSLTALASGQQGAARMTAYRAEHANLRNASGAEIGLASSPLYSRLVDASTSTALTSTTVSSKQALDVNVVQSVGSPLPYGVDNTTAFTAGTTGVSPLGGVYNDSVGAATSGTITGLRATSARALHVNMRDSTGNSFGSTLVGSAYALNANIVANIDAVTDTAAFTAGTSTLGLIGGVYNDGISALTSGTSGTVRITPYRAAHTNLRTSAGTELGTIANPLLNATVSNNGQKAIVDPHGYLQVRERSSVLFTDPMATATLDTTNRWTSSVGGAGTVVQTVGGIAVSNTATAASFAQIASIPTFTPQGSQDLLLETGVILPAAATNSPSLFFGFGTLEATPTTAAPVLNGIGFLYISSSNQLYGAVYANGVSQSSINLPTITPTNYNKFRITWTNAAIYWYVNDTDTPAASTTNYLPTTAGFTRNDMSVVAVNVGGSPSAAGTMRFSQPLVGDVGRNNLQISDGIYPWRQASVDASGNQLVSIVGQGQAATTGSLTSTTSITATVTSAGNCTISIHGTYVAAFTFEVSDDGGTTWYASAGAREDGTGFESVTQTLTNITQAWNFDLPGVAMIRCRCSTFTSGSASVRISPGGFLYAPFVAGVIKETKDINRTVCGWSVNSVTGVAAATLFTFAQIKGATSTGSITSISATAGKTLRLTGLVASFTSTTTSANSSIIQLRYNSAGAAVATSPIVATFRLAWPPGTLAANQGNVSMFLPITDGIEASGTGAFAVTHTEVAANGLLDTSLQGFEY
jgi:hypothetical protein